MALHGSIWLSARRQPAHHRAAPKCHTPSLWRLLSFGSAYNAISLPRLLRPSPSRQASTCGGSRLCVFQRVAANLDLCKNQVSHGQSACRRPAGTCASGRISAHHAKGVQHAKVKHPAAKQGLLVLIGCLFSPQPNLAFNRDVKASHCRPLTLALGFWLPYISNVAKSWPLMPPLDQT